MLEHSFYLYDGMTLSDAFHARGINIRYLGKFTELVSKHENLDYVMVSKISSNFPEVCFCLFVDYHCL